MLHDTWTHAPWHMDSCSMTHGLILQTHPLDSSSRLMLRIHPWLHTWLDLVDCDKSAAPPLSRLPPAHINTYLELSHADVHRHHMHIRIHGRSFILLCVQDRWAHLCVQDGDSDGKVETHTAGMRISHTQIHSEVRPYLCNYRGRHRIETWLILFEERTQSDQIEKYRPLLL